MPALPPKPLPKPLPKPMAKPLPKPPQKPMADLGPAPGLAPASNPAPVSAPKPIAKPVSEPAIESAQDTMQASFLIGPPGAPKEMKALYERAGQELKDGNDSLARKLFDLRLATIKYIIQPSAKQKPMLQRILEEKLGREIKTLESAIGQSFVRGEMVHNLTISLKNSVYTDGTPIGKDLSAERTKSLENALCFVFKATWVQASLR